MPTEPVQVISNVIIFRAKDMLPSREATSLQTTQNKKIIPFNNGRVQVIRVGYNNEVKEIRVGMGGLSNMNVVITAKAFGIYDIPRAIRLIEICEREYHKKEQSKQ